MNKLKEIQPPLNKYILVRLRNRDLEWYDDRDQKGLLYQVALFNGEYFETFGAMTFDSCDVIEWSLLPYEVKKL